VKKNSICSITFASDIMAVTDEIVDNFEKLRNRTSKFHNKPLLPPVAAFHSK